MRTRKAAKKGRSEKGRGTLTLRNGFWYFRITIEGTEYPYATKRPQDDFEGAKAERDKFLANLARERAAKAGSTDHKIVIGSTPGSFGAQHETVTVGELIDDYVFYLKQNGKRSAKGIEQSLNATFNTEKMYKNRLAVSITSDDLQAYRTGRKALGMADATINNELSYLRSAYHNGRKRQTPKKVIDVPYFPIVDVENTRFGTLDVSEFMKVLACMPESLKMFFVLAYHSGCRSGELKSLQWSQIKESRGVIELEKGSTKNKDGRNLPIYGAMEEWLTKQKAVRNIECPKCDYILFWHKADVTRFHNKRILAGDPLKSFGKSWDRAVEFAGHPDLTPHDMRRSAVTNMVEECGITEGEAMHISGHRTRAMLDRYHIVSLKGIQRSGKVMDTWMKEQLGSTTIVPAEMPETIIYEKKRRVRELAAQGLSIEKIAAELEIAASTGHYHLSDKNKAATLGRNRKNKHSAPEFVSAGS